MPQLLALYTSAAPCYVMGEGSNTIFTDDYDGVVLVNKITGVEVSQSGDGVRLKVGAGENWHTLVAFTVEQGWGGLENLALIPGSVGAAPIQNIGAYGLEAGERIAQVDVVDVSNGELFSLSQSECEFGYRDSIFKRPRAQHWVVTHVHFWLPANSKPITAYAELAALDNPGPVAIFNKVIEVRQQKLPDPAVLGNAGSFFKNPTISGEHYHALQAICPTIPGFKVSDEEVKVPAAWLIDQAGFKGVCKDGVCCYQHQPLVLVNQHKATGKALLALAREIQSKVKERFGVQLAAEVRLIGKQGRVTL
ncbi:UDP-N-acetylenolpyruvoylglucosamine reductase [Alteromonas lipolytica]|nr:UDP-N-acetylenolpyruvoylglucosamine reductase [Alteromonas lipolytica]